MATEIQQAQAHVSALRSRMEQSGQELKLYLGFIEFLQRHGIDAAREAYGANVADKVIRMCANFTFASLVISGIEANLAEAEAAGET